MRMWMHGWYCMELRADARCVRVYNCSIVNRNTICIGEVLTRSITTVTDIMAGGSGQLLCDNVNDVLLFPDIERFAYAAFICWWFNAHTDREHECYHGHYTLCNVIYICMCVRVNCWFDIQRSISRSKIFMQICMVKMAVCANRRVTWMRRERELGKFVWLFSWMLVLVRLTGKLITMR